MRISGILKHSITIPGVSIISFFLLFTIIQHPLTLIHFNFHCVCLVWPPYNTHITSENSFLSPSPFFMSYEKKVSFLSIHLSTICLYERTQEKKIIIKRKLLNHFHAGHVQCIWACYQFYIHNISLLIADNYSSLIPEVGCLCWLL